MEEQKRNIVQAINDMRREAGLQPYDATSLEELSTEELERLYRRQAALRESYKKEEKPKFKLKIGLPISILAISVLALSLFLLVPKILAPAQEKKTVQGTVTIGFYNLSSLNSIFMLSNKGSNNITSFSLNLDGKNKNYEIVNGSLPLLPSGNLLFLVTENLCDKEHVVEIIIDKKNITLTIQPFHCQVR